MNRTLHIVLTSMGLTLLSAYLIWALFVLPDDQPLTECKELKIEIADSVSRRFITSREVKRLLADSDLSIVGMEYGEISTQQVENIVEKSAVVRSAECYKLQDGTVCLLVEQRMPHLRVITAEGNYYIDSDRRRMRATSHTASYVPVVTGRVTERMAKEELFDFVSWLNGNSFWDAQIEQINVTPTKEIELIPRIGSHTILLGSLDDYEQKLHKLQLFYTEGLSKIGWKDYTEIDLRYKHQVIGRR